MQLAHQWVADQREKQRYCIAINNDSLFQMATKRMFSKNIVGSDAFMDMSIGSQLLYFHLGMESDDDGFIGNPKKIMRGIGCKDGDMQELIMKRFVLVFDSGVVVMKHHRINNNWDSYNCKRTAYEDEFSMLFIKENKSYTFDKIQGLPVQSAISLKSDGIQSLEENRIDKKRIEYNTNTFFIKNKNTDSILKEGFKTRGEASKWVIKNYKPQDEDYFALEIIQGGLSTSA
jgi:hypothetical protein